MQTLSEMQTPSEMPRIGTSVVENADSHRQSFDSALPFRHISIDDFFDVEFAERLLADFPSFDRRLAINEAGLAGGKAVNTKIREISPAYEELYAFISSAPFLEFMSRLSGISGLLLDPKMYGGGTHENQHGQDLDPHIDFNYAENNGLHRRLNLIVYLNKGWKTEWGGAIEIHSNPRIPEQNQIRAFDPIFNRAVMFETNEVSWHGFPRIELPPEERKRSRKSISIYLYTKERPAGEIAPTHGTFYVQRPLPPRFAADHVLTDEDVIEVKSLVVRRDRWIEFYQKMELDKNRTIAELGQYVHQLQAHARLPLTGYVLQVGDAIGVWGDGWIASIVKFSLRPLEPVESLTVCAYRPEQASPGRVRILIDGTAVTNSDFPPGKADVIARFNRDKNQIFAVEIHFEAQKEWSTEGDHRDLALMLMEIRAGHPKKGLFGR
jgi:hypothetical protein